MPDIPPKPSPESAPSDSPSLLRSSAVVGSGTALSRILGLVRDIVITGLLGAGALHDIFVVALRIPNLFRRLLAEGAFSQALAPVMAQWRHDHGERATAQLTGEVFWCLLLVLAALIGLLEWAAPEVVALIAPGFIDDPQRFAGTVDTLRIVLVYLVCVSLGSICVVRLHQNDRFALAAYAPLTFNLGLIGAALLATDQPLRTLAWGVVVAGVLHLIVLFAPVLKAGWINFGSFNLASNGVRRVGMLMAPAVLMGSVGQINQIVGTVLASFLVEGSPTWLYLSDRLVQLPVGLFAVTLSVVLLPTLSQAYAHDNRQGFSQRLGWGFSWLFVLSLPAAAGLWCIGEPLVRLLFERGEFVFSDSIATAASLSVYALGVPAYMLVAVLTPGYFARQNPSVPLTLSLLAVILNLALALLLTMYLDYGHVGIAIANVAAVWTQALLMLALLLRTPWCTAQRWPADALRALIAGAVMLALLLGVFPVAEWGTSSVHLALLLAAHVIGGAAVYAAVLWCLGWRPQWGDNRAGL